MEYQPIDCNFYDRLEASAVKREFSRFEYTTKFGEILQAGGVIKDLFIQKGVEYLKLSTGEQIRLDRIIKMNEHYMPGKESSGKNHCSK